MLPESFVEAEKGMKISDLNNLLMIAMQDLIIQYTYDTKKNLRQKLDD